jgi:membrane-bound lytic murein transglycosylase A
MAPYYTRQEIESQGLLAGSELVWLEDALDAYIVHVNGSAKLRLEPAGGGEPEVMYVGYAGKTDRPYRGLGQALVDAGLVSRDELSLAAIKRLYKRDPKAVEEYMARNQSYVFFTEYDGGHWPAGSLNARVTPERSLATDKRVYPRGGLVLADTKAVTFTGERAPFVQFMLDQDTGGAIKAPGRADIFMGVGPGAEILAGGQYAEGRLYYFFVKPQGSPMAAAAPGAAHTP